MASERVLATERQLLRLEPWLVQAAVMSLFVSIPLWRGGVDLSWDALNHHIYLGWMADQQRFRQDFLAAGSQSTQFPYLYWPAYKLAMAGASGPIAGTVLALLQATIALPAWLIARVCVPGETWFDAGMRALAVLLAVCTGAVLRLVDTTSNDVLAAIPMMWAIALAAAPRDPVWPAWLDPRASACLSGLLAGVAVACKLSNGPLALLLPVLWAWGSGAWSERAGRVVRGGIAAVGGFVLTYAWWGWTLWQAYGNPFHPLFDGLFAPLRQAAGSLR
jgi:hypothetical protein